MKSLLEAKKKLESVVAKQNSDLKMIYTSLQEYPK